MLNTDTVLECRSLIKRYGKQNVLNKVDITVNRGDIYLLLGPNGAGKTTLLSIITGILKSDGGSVHFKGSSLKSGIRIGGFIENPAFYNDKTGYDNLKMIGWIHRKRPDIKRIDSLCCSLALDPAVLKKKVSKYSTGMRKKLALVRALLFDPDLLVLDEPANGLDPEGINEIREAVQYANRQEGITILLSSHLLIEARKIATKIGILREGRVVLERLLDENGAKGLRIKTGQGYGVKVKSIVQAMGFNLSLSGGTEVDVFAPEDKWPGILKKISDNNIPLYTAVPLADDIEQIYFKASGL
ncbi:MAG: ATP-binding cassette domain-containing protein [Spirochaetes bacterium]|nr:ATP-binding cassette domain-containing protein [Spirochaetota bacterium]